MTQANPAMYVEEFRQILLWPIAVSQRDGDSEKASADMVKKLSQAVSREDAWQWIRDGLDHIVDDVDTPKLDDKHSPFAYQEFVYFHDFVARFLYEKQNEYALDSKDPMQAFYLFRHQSLRGVSITVPVRGGAAERVDLHVARCNLYLFRTGIAILALEVTNKDPRAPTACPDPLPLNTVLRVSDTFRRLYTPFFESAAPFAPQAVPISVTWMHRGDQAVGPFAPLSLAEEVARLETRDLTSNGGRAHRKELGNGDACDAPIAPHWLAVLPKAIHFSSDPSRDEHASFIGRHILDERMAVLSYVRLQKPPTLSDAQTLDCLRESDWMRLCLVDQPGDDYPYDERFLNGFDRSHAYDRFRSSGTRHLFSSYSYVVVCAGDDFAKPILVHHFRRMYFQMALIAYMEYATYVAISSKVSRAIEAADERGSSIDGRSFRETLFAIQRDFIDFVHRFRFSTISNQVQAIEMYAMFRSHLRLGPIFEDLKAELNTATSYLRDTDAAEQSQSAEGLNVVAVIGATLGLAIGLLGALPNFKSWFGDSFDKAQKFTDHSAAVANASWTTIWTGLTFLGFSVAALALTYKATALFSQPRRRRRQSVTLIQSVLVAICGISVFAMMLAIAALVTRR